jgi:hypothetical protein
MSSTYRLSKETCVVISMNGKPEVVVIPEGSVITANEPPPQHKLLVPVQFGSITVEMFAVDLEYRAELLSAAAG